MTQEPHVRTRGRAGIRVIDVTRVRDVTGCYWILPVCSQGFLVGLVSRQYQQREMTKRIVPCVSVWGMGGELSLWYVRGAWYVRVTAGRFRGGVSARCAASKSVCLATLGESFFKTTDQR